MIDWSFLPTILDLKLEMSKFMTERQEKPLKNLILTPLLSVSECYLP
jgi:hypothetical protein